MSDEKGDTSDVYVDLAQLLYQLTNARVALIRLPDSMLTNLVKHVTAVTRVAHGDTVLEMKHQQSEVAVTKSFESYCNTCEEKMILEKHRSNCKTCRRRLTFHCLKCNSKILNYSLVSSHLCNRMVFSCSFCKFFCNKSQELLKHVKLVHKKNLVFPCYRCNKKIKNFTGFRSHEKYCGKAANISCKKCGRNFKFESDLRQHVKQKHLKKD